MKNLIFASLILLSASCNNDTAGKKGNDSVPVAKSEPVTTPVAGTSVKDVVEHYLHIKNALANDDGKDAANGGNALVEVFSKFEQPAPDGDNKKSFAEITSDGKEHAEHIAKNAGKIEHQREHFAMLSKDVYDLVKAASVGQTLYHDFCPMYNNNKGATWLSETKDIRNPYLGKKMPDCGTVKETIQ